MFERAYSHCREACTFIGGLALGMYTFGYTYVHIPIWASTEFDRDFLNYSEKFKKEKKLLWATSKNASTRIKYVRKKSEYIDGSFSHLFQNIFHSFKKHIFHFGTVSEQRLMT
jgi:hypothetical protein